MEGLTKRQKKVFEFLIKGIQEQGFPPSIREIGKALGISSLRGVTGHLEALQRKGYIERGSGARTIRIQRARLATFGWWGQVQPLPFGSGAKVPLVGSIAAGQPILAEESIEDELLVDERFVPKGTVFALRIKGESMIGAGILDGDYVLVHQQPTVQEGEVAAVLVGDEATVKRFHKRQGVVELISENPRIKPIRLTEKDPTIRILGKVCGVMRRV